MRQNKVDALAALRKEVLSEIKRRGQTVEQFCWENGLNKATLSNFINDKKDFRVSTLVQIAAALNKKLDIGLR